TKRQIQMTLKKAKRIAHAQLLETALNNEPIGACWVSPDNGDPYCEQTHQSVCLQMDAIMRNNPDPDKRGFANFTAGERCV
ncbi:hypothetical protein, partial [Mesorhizobium sp. CU2]|uniref:hypothetical protein n=1 Tax=Mesorhizobium sp. CU2 TaxID=2589985 RepID=UPI001AEF358C